MKKLFLSVSFVISCLYKTDAQNSLIVGIDHDICVDGITAVYTNDESTFFELGCTGMYTFDITTHVLSYIVVNGTTCKAEETTTVTLSTGKTVVAKVKAIGKISFRPKDGATN